MQGFVFNTRREKFQDPLVREALVLRVRLRVVQQDAVLRRLYADLELLRQQRAGLVRPAGARRAGAARALSRPPAARGVRARVSSRRSPTDRATTATICARRVALLKAAGYEIKGDRLVNAATGQPFEFEILLERRAGSSASSARSPSPWSGWGSRSTMRTVDDAQYQKRHREFDFDMITACFGQSLSPGNEQRRVLGQRGRRHAGQPQPDRHQGPDRRRADRASHQRRLARGPGHRLPRARSRAPVEPLRASRNWHQQVTRVAYWDKLDHPATWPRYGCRTCSPGG